MLSSSPELDVPRWFQDAVAVHPHVSDVVVDGARISYRSWGSGSVGTSDVLLAHGGAAHARWWDHLAPLLAVDRRVVAIDLSGHGDSDHRTAYSLDGWADEVEAVLSASDLAARPVLAGHSMGGLVSATLAARGAPELGGVIVVDSPIEPVGPPTRAEADSPSFGNARIYPTADDATARFRPVPPQETLPYIAAYVAANSIREVDGGWSWKFDPRFAALTGDAPRTLDGLPCRVAFIAGERGILTPAARRALDESTEVAVVEVPDAGHAIMLDQPLALLTAIRGILAGWSQS